MISLMRPALSPAEWNRRRSGAVCLDVIDHETHVIVADPDLQLVSVTGPNELHALAALANDALPVHDPRKLTWTDLAILGIIVDRIDRTKPYTGRLLELTQSLYAKISALLPPP